MWKKSDIIRRNDHVVRKCVIPKGSAKVTAWRKWGFALQNKWPGDDLTGKIFEFGMGRTRRTGRQGDGMKMGCLQDANFSFLLLYQGMIGSLMYLVTSTCPDLAFSVLYISHFSSHPLERHHTAVKRVFRYLAGTRFMSLKYQRSHASVPLPIEIGRASCRERV